MFRPAKVMLAAVALLVGSAHAQDLDPRRYVNLPVDQNFLGLAYAWSKGDVNVSPSIPLEDASLVVDGPAIAYVRTFGFRGKMTSFDIQQSHNCADGSAVQDGTRVFGKRCGFADTQLRFTHNFIGAPALAIDAFSRQDRQVVVGASIQVSVPSGKYEPSKLLNIGANRWYIRPELGVSVPWRKWSFEFSAGARFFTDNDQYLGTSTLEQDPLFNLQAHAIYNVSRRQSLLFSSNYFFGGETTRDGMPAAIRQENSRLGFAWRFSLNSRQIVKVSFNTGVVTRIGNDSNALIATWTYRWG